MNYTEYIRDIKLNLIMSTYDITIDPRKRKNTFTFLKPGYSLVKKLIKNGAIITGSRALRCYQLNGKQLFDREPRDWDFLVTEELAMKICDENSITYEDDIIPVRKQMILFDTVYGDARIIPTDIQIIVKSKLPEYKEVNGIKIAELSHIIDEKIKLVSNKGMNKHDEDLRQIITRFNNQ